MREYEIVVVYDLTVNEAGGTDASTVHLKNSVERNDGTVLRTEHWGRRRLAYPIQKKLDADYVLARVEMDVESLPKLNAELHIDEKVYRHLIVRADELPSEDISAPAFKSDSGEVRQREAVAAVDSSSEASEVAEAPEASEVAEVAEVAEEKE